MSTVGGHLAQLAVLAEALTDHDTYLVTVPSPQTESVLPGIRRYVVRQILRNPAALMANAIQSLRIFLREQPDAVVTTGAGDALPTVLIATSLGAHVVFVESFARVQKPSLFGRLARHWCDLVLYQWPDLGAAYPRGTRVAPLFRFGTAVPPPATPSVLILTGTHTRGFERLLEAVDSLVEGGLLANRVSAQIGHSRYVPRSFPSFRFLPHDDLMREIDRADVVVTHDGSASIGESLSRGRPTVVVPREAAHGEVSYGSEQQLARHLAALGYIVLLEDPSDLPRVIADLGTRTTGPPPEGPDAREVLRGFLARLGPGRAGRPHRVPSSEEGLRIALVAPVSPWESRPSGIAAYIRALVSSLSDAHCQVRVATVGAAPKESLPGVVPDILAPGTVSSTRFLALLLLNGRRLVQGQDIVHLQRLDHVVPVLASARAIPKVVTLHGEAERSVRLRKGPFQAQAFRLLERLGARYSNALVAVDERTREEYERSLPHLRGRIRVVPVGVRVPDVGPPGTGLSPELQIPDTVKLVVYAGRLEPEKNVELLLDAFPHVRRLRPDAMLLIVGDGRSEAGLRIRAESLGESVRFLPPLEQVRLWQLLQRTDVLAVPSLFESGPLVALEAIALGTPVVTTPVGRVQEVVTHWNVGKVASPEPVKYAIAIADVLSLGKPHYSHACLSAAKELSFHLTFAETLRVYRSALGAGGA